MTASPDPNHPPITAYVLITVPANHSGHVAERLVTEMSGVVKEAAIIYGDADVVAKVEADDMRSLHHVVMRQIQGIEGVQVTRTFIAVPPILHPRE